MKKDKDAALEVIRSAILDLVNERVPVGDLVLSKKLSKMSVNSETTKGTLYLTNAVIFIHRHYKTMVPHLEVSSFVHLATRHALHRYDVKTCSPPQVRKAIAKREPSRVPMLGDREFS